MRLGNTWGCTRPQPWLLRPQEVSSREALMALGSAGFGGSQAGQDAQGGHFSEDGVFRAGKVFKDCGTMVVCIEPT